MDMIRIICLLLLSIFSLTAKAQTKTLAEEAKSFVLKGYEMLDYITGDLNGDNRPDAILILKLSGEDTITAQESKRPLLLLIRQANGKLRQVKRNDDIVMCRQCGGVFGDPYDNTKITRNEFTIYFYGGSSWRWGNTYRFAYKPLKLNWYLVNEKQISYQTGDPEATTKEVVIEELELGEVPLDGFNSTPSVGDAQWKVTAAKTFFYDNPKLGSKPRKGYLLKDNRCTGIRELKNFVEISFENGKGGFSSGYILKKDLTKIN
jgi:hypothetical protein